MTRLHRVRGLLLAVAAVLALPFAAAAQTRATAEQVLPAGNGLRLVVRVTDAAGGILPPDTAGVAVRIGSTSAPVVRVATAADLPRAVVFVLCHRRAQRPQDVAATVGAYAAMADRLTRPGDRAALVACGDHARIVSNWAPPADVRRALDGVSAAGDVADEAEALRLAAALPGNGLRRVALLRTDGRHLDAATEAEVARAGLPVFAMAMPGTADVLPLVNLARSTGGSYLDGDPDAALTALLRRLDAAWVLDVSAPAGASGAVSVRVGDASTRLVQALPVADSSAAAAPATGRDSAAGVSDSRSGGDRRPSLLWVALGALAVAGLAGWVLFGRRPAASTAAADPAPYSGPVSGFPAAAAPVANASDARPVGVPDLPRVRLQSATLDVVLDLDRPRVIGRDAACDLVLTDPSVSARHASIAWEDGHVVVRDLGSTNGLLVNGVAVARGVLANESRLQLGETALVVSPVPAVRPS